MKVGLGFVGHPPSAQPPVIANQSIDFGALTKASAGKIAPVNTGAAITSATIDSGDGSGHWQISSAGEISPSSAGDTANLSGGPYSLVCTFTNANGSDGATITVNILADSYSVVTMAEAKTAAADIGTASGGARTIYCRTATYLADAGLISGRAYANRVTVTKHTGATPTFPALTIHNSDNVTFDGLSVFGTSGTLIVVTGPSDAAIIQNCSVAGPTIDPGGSYTLALPITALNGIATGQSSGYPSNLSIINNTFNDIIIAITVSCDGALRIKGNKIENVFSDAIKVGYRSGKTSDEVTDNTVNGLIGASTDFGNPHPDFIQFTGGLGTETADWSNIEIGRNTLIARYARAGTQGIFLDDMNSGTYYFNAPYIHGNLLINAGLATGGIRCGQAKSARVIGNTVVKQGSLSGTGPGIYIGEGGAGTGTHEIHNNAADSFSITGSSTQSNNVTLGSGGATIAYAIAFDGPTFSPTTVAGARTSFSMKDNGPLDADNSGTASVGDIGAVGSGYVTWATTEPGNNGSTDTAYEISPREAQVGSAHVNITGTRQAFLADILLNEVA